MAIVSVNRDLFVLDKDPGAVLDYSVTWEDWLVVGDAVSVSTWAVFPVDVGGVVVDSEVIAGPVATAWASGGIAGRQYRLTNQVVTDAGRTEQRSVILNIVDR